MQALSEFPYTIQTVYADLQDTVMQQAIPGVELDMAQQMNVGALGAVGAIGTACKVIHGHRYWYAQYTDASGRQQQSLLGAESPAVLELVEHLRSTMSLDVLKHRRSMVGVLKKAGYAAPNRWASGALNIMARVGLFKSGVTMIGTPAYGVIMNQMGFMDRQLTQTADVDFSFNSLKISVPENVSLENILKELHPKIFPVAGLDPREPPTSFHIAKSDFRVDVISNGDYADEGKPVKVQQIGFCAAQMPFQDFLTSGSVPSLVLTPYGCMVNVPTPGRMMLHKIAASACRSHAFESKRRKDLRQANSLLLALKQSRDFEIDDAIAAIAQMREPDLFAQKIHQGIKAGLSLGLEHMNDLLGRVANVPPAHDSEHDYWMPVRR